MPKSIELDNGPEQLLSSIAMGNMDIQAVLIESVRKMMQDNRIDGVELAERCDITQSTLSRILTGKQKASIALWQKLYDGASGEERR